MPETVPPMFVASSILKLQPGDLFISSRPAIEGTWLGLRLPDQRTSGWCLALKPDDEVARRSKPMRLDRKCLSLGQNYKIRLPIDPEEWLLSSDPTRWPALGILETGPAIGFPSPHDAGEPLWLDLTSWEMVDRPYAIALRWAILLPGADGHWQPAYEFGA